MRYEYIPVDFENQTSDDYETFCETLDHLGDEQIHVHCIYKARVSAFFYRYAKDGKGGSKADAFALMDGIWRPGGVWATFIYDEKSQNLANRYAGHDY